MTRRSHNSIIDEYLFLKKKVAKCIVKSKQNEKAVITNRAILTKAKKFIRRMLEIEEICHQEGWPHPDTFEVGYVEKDPSKFKMPVDSKMLAKPDGTLPSSKIQPLPIAEATPIRGVASEGFVIDDKIRSAANPDGTLFETPKLEGSFVKRRSETE
jgi:hypothetical protein